MLALTMHWAFWETFLKPWFWCGFGGWVIASLLKVVFASHRKRRMDFSGLFSTGGMPSSHSAVVSALAFSIGYTEGFGEPIAAGVLGYAVVTMFDAATVRREAGKHAKVLNVLRNEDKDLRRIFPQRLRELLGHTRMEVFWGMVTGLVWATLLCVLWR